MVNTVLGSISASKMGATMVHEHCFMDSDTEFWVKPEDIPKKFVHLFRESVSISNLDLVKRVAATLWITEIMEISTSGYKS